MSNELPITQINATSRLRTDLGDLEGLADSLRTLGLIQPIVVRRSDSTLVAGGRRLAAAKLLGWSHIPVTFKEDLDDAGLRELELEENVRRKDMTWQERCLCIAEIHKLKGHKAGKDGTRWTQEATGELLNCGPTTVIYSLQIAERIRANDTEVISANGFTDALRVLIQRKENAARAALVALAMPTKEPVHEVHSNDISEVTSIEIIDETRPPTKPPFNLSSCLHNTDCLDFIKNLKDASVDHIITDPPYAIDMDNLQQENSGMDVSSVRAEHEVVPNKTLLSNFLPEAFRVLGNNGFMCLWYDNVLWEFLYTRALSAGFKVQRWPFVWCKPQAMNQSAQYNFTKATEFCMILRKGNATLVKPQALNWFEESRDGERYDHPFAKPFRIWEKLISAVSIEGQTIFDPFAGVGSCPLSCLTVGRKFLACELNTEHFNKLFLNVQTEVKRLTDIDMI